MEYDCVSERLEKDNGYISEKEDAHVFAYCQITAHIPCAGKFCLRSYKEK